MKHARVFLPLLATAGVWVGAQEPPAAEAEKKRVRDLAVRARQAEAKGDRAEALRAYEAVRTETTTPATPELARAQVDATLRSARTLEALALTDKAPAATLDEARTRYEQVIARGDAGQKLAGRNALGVMLLRQGRTAEALATLQQIDLSTVPVAQAFVFHSNLGRAYEGTGQLDDAFRQYQISLGQQASFRPAQLGASRVLGRRRPPSSRDAITLIDGLANKGETRAAAECTRELLVAWAGLDAAPDLLPQLARGYAAARVTQADFDASEWPVLRNLTGGLRPALDQLAEAYRGHVALSAEAWGPPQAFSAWADRGPRARAMASLLRFLGEVESAAERPQAALARAWTAWLLDRDPDNALATASVLEAHPELQAGPPRVLDLLVRTLFETKGDAYARRDWPTIVRLHTILGGIFEQQGRWGPQFGAEGALFQWEHAAAATVQARLEQPAFGASPGIDLHLAECYRRLKRLPDAWEQYLRAAEAFLADGRPADAMRAAAAGRALGVAPPAKDEQRLEAIQAAIDASRL